MAPKPRILAVGSTNTDFVAKVNVVPNAGETIISDGSYSFVPGGKGANAAVAAARLGADVVFCARIGNDSNGKMLRATYESEKIDTRYLTTDKSLPTGLAAIFVESNGANRIVVFPGANSALCREDVEEALTSYPDALLVQFEIPLDTVYYSVEQANKGNVPVIIDAGPIIPGLDLSKFGKIEIFSPNESEAEALTGIKPYDPESYIRICLDLYSKLDTKYVVLKLGHRGCYVYDGKMGIAIPSYYVTAVDTTAAGDAFTAAMTYEYLRSGDIKSACRYANAVGALTVTKNGALPSLPTEEQVIAFIREN
ncbi:MAG: ribokinase [Ruminococcaceae bacterium]|nr:ribokinase [Oscillospiraceae bacterium]